MVIRLVPFGSVEFDRLISWVPAEADLIAWCAAFFRHPLTRSQLQAYLDSARQPHAREIFTAREQDGTAVGHIEISHIWPHLSSRLSRILVAPEWRRQGVASAMISLALRHTFEVHGVDRVDLGVSAANAAAIGCYERLGFARVGVWPSAIGVGAHRIDVAWLTLARNRWHRVDESSGGDVSAATER